MNLPQLPLDKALHALYGVGFGLAGAVLSYPVGIMPALGAVVLSAAAALGKEAVDLLMKSGEPSPADALATVVGGVAVAVATLL